VNIVFRAARKVVHLERRFFRALSDAPPPRSDVEWAMRPLNAGERELWRSMQHQDQRHSLEVARRFVSFAPEAPDYAVAAALLHDVGKVASRLGTFARVAATIVGSPTKRFRLYHDHERIGADLLRGIDSDPRTIALIELKSDDAELASALQRADNI
jgi:putative nucleotidyltransferase with HDIG domain